MKIKLHRVKYMPTELQPGVLYVAEEFGAAAHLCACGCGAKIRTPLGTTEWALEETRRGPTLYPSVGNWQQACQSHYWIEDGEIIWAEKWSPAEIVAGQRWEKENRHAHYAAKHRRHEKRAGLANWLRRLFGH